MLARTGGNIGGVYLETERLRIARQAEDHINEIAARATCMEYEIDEGAAADWYLVNTFPGEDLKAMRYLARRRFGVFRPMQQRKERRNESQPIGVMEAVFPSWLFVYCCEIDKHRSRISVCPGVMGLLANPLTNAPVPIPDEFVKRLRALAWVYEEGLTHVARESARHQQRHTARRPTKQERKQLDKLKKAFKDHKLEWDQSTWDQINVLEPHERIAVLQRTITNAPPVVG